MPNSFDHDGRGPSNTRLFVAGVAFALVVLLIAALMIAKYKGRLDPIVRVRAELINVGDGLPAKSDVKFRGVLVGFVSGVVPAEGERPNIVHIDLKPAYAAGIPDTVTARVVPSNVFAVSSVQFVDDGKDTAPLRAGATIHEDQSLPTVLFQTTLNKLRQLLLAFGREPSADGIGWLTAFGEATQGRGDRLKGAGRDLNEIVTQLNTIVGDGTGGPSTLSAFTDAANGLRDASPELFETLASAVKPMRTLAEKRSALTNLLSGGLGTVGTFGDAFDHHTDRLIAITTQLTPVVGVLADHADAIRRMVGRTMKMVDGFRYVGWNDAAQLPRVKAVISLTPTRTYVRADCPRYGEVKGPSCGTAPEVPVAPALSSALGSRGLPLPPGVSENSPNLAPPRDSIRGRGEVAGPPLAPEQPAPAPPIAEQPPPLGPEPAPPGDVLRPPLPAEIAPPDQPDAPSNPVPPPAVQPQSAVVGGNVGPVGSRQEKDQLSLIVGGDANAATEFLLGPLARGATVHLAPDPGGER
jgi:virulence factor Mce-like protein